VKNDGDRFPKSSLKKSSISDGFDEDAQMITFQKKRNPSQILYRPAQERAESKTNSLPFLQRVKQKHGWPIISITIPDRSLNDIGIGVIANRSMKGRVLTCRFT
jgi:hypothetical protein